MAKRANGEGTIYERPDGRWCAQIMVTSPDGRRRRKTLYGKTQSEVVRMKRECERLTDRGVPQSTHRAPTIAEYGTTWIAGPLRRSVQMGHLQPSTRDSYASLWRLHIEPSLGHLRLDQVTPTHINAWLASKIDEVSAYGKSLSPRTVQYCHSVLRRALNDALRDELVSRNAAALVRPPRVEPPARTPLTVEEAEVVLRHTKEDEKYVLWLTLIALGLRVGEALALRWDDVDTENRTIHVHRSVRRQRDEPDALTGRHRTHLESRDRTKTGVKGSAHLAVPPFVMDALSAHRRAQAQQRLAAIRWDDQELVFASSVGTLQDARNVLRQWKATCSRAGIERNVRVKDLRHSTASFLHRRGVDIKTIQTILRHTRLSTTADLYTTVFEEVRREAADAMDDLLRGFAG